MSTLADPGVRAALRERLQQLSPDSKAKWGRMTAHQMVCHINDSFRIGTGERHASPATNLFQRTFIKWVALHTTLQWPKGVPTRPEGEQGRGGTRPASWEGDCADLLRLIDAFPELQVSGTHPVFGDLTKSEWLTWGYRHVDHHFRQFGV
jgi:Protein of unknown function (DUF1569)